MLYFFYSEALKVKISKKICIHLQQLPYFNNHNVYNINQIFNKLNKILFLSPIHLFSWSFIGGRVMKYCLSLFYRFLETYIFFSFFLLLSILDGVYMCFLISKSAYWLIAVGKEVFKKVFGLAFVVGKVNKSIRCILKSVWISFLI